MLALQPVVLLEPLLDLLQAPRLGLERVGVAAQLAAQVLGLDPQRRQPAGQLVELRVDPLDRPGELLALGQQLRHAAVARRRGDRLRPAARGGQQPVHLSQPLPLAVQRRALLLGGFERLDLLDLEREQVEVAIARAGALAQLLELVLELPDARVAGRQAVAQRQLLATAEPVEQVELRRGEREPPVLVLAEEGDQPPAERLQVGRRGRPPLDERARAPLGGHAAGEHDLLERLVDPLPQLGQLGLVEQTRGQREHALHVRLTRTRPDDPRARLAAEQEVERVGEHRLARAGLAGDRGQARPRPQLGALDQQQVLDAELQEHAAGIPARPDGASGSTRPNLSRRRW